MILSITGLVLAIVSLVLTWLLKKKHQEIEAAYEERERLSKRYIEKLEKANAVLREKIKELTKTITL